jgi:hypothetical protein
MRLSYALPALAGGLVVGWAAIAAADAPPPPAAPIFYCPSTGQKPAQPQACPTAAPAAAPPAQHVAVAEHRHVRHRREVRIAERHAAPPREDVSASQAFIYRYEQAEHGFNARAAEEAWGRDGRPPCPDERGCPPEHREWAERPAPPQVIVEHAPPQPQQVIVERAPPPPQQVIIEREAPPPPKIIIEHAPAPPPQIVFERAPAPPPQVIYERAPACPDSCPPPQNYGWQDRQAGAGYSVERRESERAGGWRYSEQDGRAQYQAWGDAPRRRPCPPQVPEDRCSGAAGYAQSGYSSGYSSGYASDERGWQDGGYGRVVEYSGRDASGYLVWPGKTQ